MQMLKLNGNIVFYFCLVNKSSNLNDYIQYIVCPYLLNIQPTEAFVQSAPQWQQAPKLSLAVSQGSLTMAPKLQLA